MSLLLLVRHGQASFLSPDYDQLSPLGETQSRLLGRYWIAQGLTFTRVYVGPRRRHLQTCESVAGLYKGRRLSWPEPTILPELDEYPAEQVLKYSLPHFLEGDESMRELAMAFMDGTADPSRRFQRYFEAVTRRWVRRELPLPALESWQDFRARVESGVAKMLDALGKGETIAAFTSGGPVAAATGQALGLDDEKTLELSWMVRNAAYAELFFSSPRLRLSAFNALPHLTDSTMLTYI